MKFSYISIPIVTSLCSVFFSQLFCSSLAFSSVSAFENVSDQELLRLHEVARERVLIIDEYLLARYGRPQENDIQKKAQVLKDFDSRAGAWMVISSLRSQDGDAACERYINNTTATLSELRRGYENAKITAGPAETRLVLRSRLEGLYFILQNQMSLAEENAEGGKVPLTGQGRQCRFLNRQVWKEASANLKRTATELNSVWWGVRGVQNSFPITTPLSDMLVKDAESKRRWFVPKIAGETLTTFFALDFLTGSLLSSGVGAVLVAGGIGAYQGYIYGSGGEKQSSYAGDPWTQYQLANEELLDLNIHNVPVYYDIASQMETTLFQLNSTIVKQLKPQMELASRKFGSLEAARLTSKKKQEEIEDVMKKRNLAEILHKF